MGCAPPLNLRRTSAFPRGDAAVSPSSKSRFFRPVRAGAEASARSRRTLHRRPAHTGAKRSCGELRPPSITSTTRKAPHHGTRAPHIVMPTPFSSLPGAATFSLRFPSRSKDFFLARPIFPIPGRPFLRLRPPSSGPGVRPQCRRQPGYEPGAPLFAAPRRQLSPHRDIFLTTPGPRRAFPMPAPDVAIPTPFSSLPGAIASPLRSLPPTFSPAPAHTLPRVQPGVFAPPPALAIRPVPINHAPRPPGDLPPPPILYTVSPLTRSPDTQMLRKILIVLVLLVLVAGGGSLCAGRHQQRHHRRQVQRLRRKQHRGAPLVSEKAPELTLFPNRGLELAASSWKRPDGSLSFSFSAPRS